MKDRHICIGVRLIIYDAPIEDDGEIGDQHQYFGNYIHDSLVEKVNK